MIRPYYEIGVDKLTLCYNISEDSILHSIEEEDTYLDLGDIKLKRIESGHFKNSFVILSLWDAPDGEGLTWQTFGTLKYNHYADKEEKSTLGWIYFDNHTLYKQVYPHVSSVIYGEYISELLGMELRNITEIEIYFDTSSNSPRTVKHIIRNKNIETLLNGKVLPRKENHPTIGYYHTGDSNRYTDLSLYVKQADKDGFSLKVYDKLKEIKESSHKDYILKWHKRSSNQPLYRVELSLRNHHIKEYLSSNHIELSHNLFTNREFLFESFLHFTHRLIRFREAGTTHSILEAL